MSDVKSNISNSVSRLDKKEIKKNFKKKSSESR